MCDLALASDRPTGIHRSPASVIETARESMRLAEWLRLVHGRSIGGSSADVATSLILKPLVLLEGCVVIPQTSQGQVQVTGHEL